MCEEKNTGKERVQEKIGKKKDPQYRESFRLAAPAFPVRFQTSIIGSANLTSVFGMVTGVSLHL